MTERPKGEMPPQQEQVNKEEEDKDTPERTSKENILKKLDGVFEGASVNMWVDELKKIQAELGSDKFRDDAQSLFTWAVKTRKDANFLML